MFGIRPFPWKEPFSAFWTDKLPMKHSLAVALTAVLQ